MSGTGSGRAGSHPIRESQVLLNQGLLYAISAAAPVLATLVITPILTRSISAAEYGSVGIGLVLIQLGLVTFGFGLQEPIARHGILEPSGIAGAKGIVLTALLPSACLAFAVHLTGPLWFPPLFGSAYRGAFGYALLAAWLFSIVAGAQGVMRAQNRPLPLVCVGLLAAILAPSLGLAIVHWYRPTATSYLFGMAAGYLVAAMLALGDIVRGDRPRRVPGDFRAAVRLGGPMIPHQISLFLATAMVVTLTTRIFGVADAGRMQLTFYVATAPAVIAVALSNSWSPLIYRTAPERRDEVSTRLVGDVATIITVLCGGLLMLLPVLLSILMPPAYRPAELNLPACVAAAASILFVPYLASVHLLMTEGKNAVLGVLVPGSIALAAVTASLIAPHSLAQLAAGLVLALGLMAVGARLALPGRTPTRWGAHAIAVPVSAVVGLCAVAVALPATGWWLLIRVAIAALVGLVGLRYAVKVLGKQAHDRPSEQPTSG